MGASEENPGPLYTRAVATVAHSPVPVALGSATADTEEGRAFFQERLGLYGMWVFILSGSFYILNLVQLTELAVLWSPFSLAHLGATLILGAVWATTRMVVFSSEGLRWLDAAALIVGCGLFAIMAGAMAQLHVAVSSDPTQALLVGQLACSSTVLTRAVAVPSTPVRTFWLGFAALAPLAGYAAWVFFHAPVLVLMPGAETVAQMAVGNTINIVAWCGVALAVSTVGSRIIFGLRAEADKVKRLGQYVLEEKIGEGGMGIVYRASHAMLRRPTAIKLLPPEKTGEDSIRRFEREVQLTAKLSHPSTVAIFDYGRTPAGVFYYAMEFLEGLNLEELVRDDGPQDAGRVIHILEQVSGALTEAHEVGLIHRDIKPANVILCERGGMPDVAKVVDFGLVRSVVTTGGDATMMMTTTNMLTGTPLYMAPESIKGAEFADGRSDLYALGAVGYFLLTGHPLFESTNLAEVVGHHLHTEPPPPSARSGRAVPPDLETIIMRCLAKAPDDRFGTARDLARALHESGKSTPWSLEVADTWWDSFKRAHQRGADGRASGDAPPTLAIDLDERCRVSLPLRSR